MSVILRLPRPLYAKIMADLARPHPFAAERVGFLFTRPGTAAAGDTLALAVDYTPVAETSYVPNDDPRIGVEIDSASIRTAMQRILDTGESVFHVHVHEHSGSPNFSRVDLRDLPQLAAAFRRVGPEVIHGGLVLSLDSGTALAWLPGMSTSVPIEEIDIVGFPLAIFQGSLATQQRGGNHRD